MTSEPRPRKSDRTRSAILAAARNQFTARGFAGASIRAIAAEARIDPAMVIRYFGSKESLFAAAADLDLQLPDLARVPRTRRGRHLVTHFIQRWEGDLSDDALVTLLRTAATDGDVAERFQRVFSTQLIAVVGPLIEGDDARRRTALIASQMLGVALTRYILRIPGIYDVHPDQLILDVSPTIQRYLYGRLDALEH